MSSFESQGWNIGGINVGDSNVKGTNVGGLKYEIVIFNFFLRFDNFEVHSSILQIVLWTVCQFSSFGD